jgi:hypothetical protein
MTYKIATFLSVLFHPLFLFFYLILYLVYFTDFFLLYRYSPNLWMLLSYVFLNTVVIPIILIFFYSRDLLMRNKEKRTIPYLIMIVVYSFMLFFFFKFYISALILRFLIALILGLTILTIINVYFKLSLHTFTMGCLIAFFIRIYFLQSGMFFYPLIVVLILAGIIGSARLALEVHTKEEILSGYAIGILPTLLVLFIR